MPVVYLLRHGQASADAVDYDALSSTGREQSRILGVELLARQIKVAAVRSGTLNRQRDTAAEAVAAAGIDLAPVQDPRWNEYDHMELLQGHPLSRDGSVQQILDAALHRWTADPDATGAWTAFRDGALAALRETADGLGAGEAGLVFTSAGIIAAICASLIDPEGAGFVALNRMVVNASITKLVHGRGGTRLLTFNDHAHFESGDDRRALLTYR